MKAIIIDKNWLYDQYIEQNKTVKDIAKEANCCAEIVHRRLKEFDLKAAKKAKLKKQKLYQDKDWLYNKYIIENLSPVEIARELGLDSRKGSKKVDYFRTKFGFKKDKDDSDLAKWRAYKATCQERYGSDSTINLPQIQKILVDSMIEKYGVTHPMKSEEIKAKRAQTNIERYGFISPAKSEDVKLKTIQTFINNNKKYIIDNKPIENFATEVLGISNPTLYNIFRSIDPDRKNFSKEEVLFAFNQERPHITTLESMASEQLNLLKYDKFFNLELHPDLRYRPDFKLNDSLALNVDGLYWHSELQKDNNYHFKMRQDYEARGLRILQFHENEIVNKIEIIKSIIRNALNQTLHKVGARKTNIKKVSQLEAKIFLNQNHIKGSINAKHLGLFYQGELVQILSYKIRKGVLKIERACSKINWSIIGGYSKLEKYLITKELHNITAIHYWVDLRYGTGRFLSQLDYKIEKETLGWEWTDFVKTYNRLQCWANMDEQHLSQQDYADELGWYKIFDAGQRLYIKSLK